MQYIYLAMKVFHKLFYNPYKFVKNNPHISVGNTRLGKSFLIQLYTPNRNMFYGWQ